jgi:pimeloyl-ACP methyl ester carboxylesterase
MLHFEVHPGEGPYLFLVHGILSSRAQWRPNLPALASVTRPVVIELLGHGRSPAPEDPACYRLSAYLDAFEAIRRQLGVEQIVTCGQSFGAGLTLNYGLAFPERVIAQVFTNTNSGLTPRDDGERARLRAERMRAVAAGGRAAVEQLPFHPRNAKRLPPDVLEELVADAEHIAPMAILHSMETTLPELSLTHRLSEISRPTLLVNGTWEKRFQPLRQRAAAAIPDCRVVDLAGGHSINLEAAADFDAAVLAFLGAQLP